MIPHDLPPHGIVYHYFRQWRLDGTWSHLNDGLRGDVRVLEGRNRQPSAASVDSQTVWLSLSPAPMYKIVMALERS